MYLDRIELLHEEIPDPLAYPFSIPALRQLESLPMAQPVTFFAGENGSGKSTLIEAMAMATGLNAEGGSRNLRFSTRDTHSELYRHLRLSWRRRPARSFFLRAESFYNTATAYEGVGIEGYHRRSHGESFLDVARGFGEEGFYLMDEPESALSPTGQLSLLRRMYDLTATGSQFVTATHSPLILAYPGAMIYQLDDRGVRRVTYEDTDAYQLTSSFLQSPERFFRHLFAEE